MNIFIGYRINTKEIIMFTKYSDLYHLSMSVCSDEEMAFKKTCKKSFWT